ncbi:hypothetical protein [Actinoplanes sp. N902-109]|uniref:hypothetical protein n=1 Tax=Actinoplanes sp. (strain N902-109) TaxID=649831 RepID=UPI001E376480|nr:hypothetical protein [Actinoplanes sp. N902-109]
MTDLGMQMALDINNRMTDLGRFGMPDYPFIYDTNEPGQLVGYTFTDEPRATLFR